MVLGDVMGQMRQARQHVSQAAAMIAQALSELDQAGALVQLSLQGSADQTPTATVRATRQELAEAAQRAGVATAAIDQTLARWAGTGGPGN